MAKNNNKYIFLRHNNSSVKTIADFMERSGVYAISEKDFFESNRALIFRQMTAFDKTAWSKSNGKKNWPTVSDLSANMTLPCPCNLRINPTKVTRELAISQTNFQIDDEKFVAFAHAEIQKIYQNEGYRANGLSKRNPTCQVFGWFKSLYYITESKKDKLVYTGKGIGQYVDLSRYLISLSTSSTAEGGSFTLTLPIINTAAVDDYFTKVNGKDKVYRQAVKDNEFGSKSFYEKGKEFYSKTPFSSIESNYFNWLISSQDLLFISFEELEMEKIRKDKNADSDSFDLETKIAGQVYDMIALVDSVKVVTDNVTSQAHVEVTGRDLMKLLIEDGSFFFNVSTTKSTSSVFANETQGDAKDINFVNGTQNNPIFRMRLDSTEIDIFRNKINMDLDYILKGVVSQLSNVEVVPNYVFDSYGDRRTKFIDLKPKK